MKQSILVLDGSSNAVYALGPFDDGNYCIGHCLDRKVEFADSLTEAEGILEESVNKPFGAVLTEPFMLFRRDASDLNEYQVFLNALRTEEKIPVVLWSTQDEGVIHDEFGLRKGVHYDAYAPKMSPSPAETLTETIDELLLSK